MNSNRTIMIQLITTMGLAYIGSDGIVKAKSENTGAVVLKRAVGDEIGKFEVKLIDAAEAKKYKLADDEACVMSSQFIASADGEEAKSSYVVTAGKNFHFVEGDKAAVEQIMKNVDGDRFTGKHLVGANVQEVSWIPGLPEVNNKFVDAAVFKIGNANVLVLLHKSPKEGEPLLSLLDAESILMSIDLVGSAIPSPASQFKLSSISRDTGDKLLCLNSDTGDFVLVKYNDAGEFSVMPQAILAGELKILDNQQKQRTVRAVIGATGPEGNIACFLDDGDGNNVAEVLSVEQSGKLRDELQLYATAA